MEAPRDSASSDMSLLDSDGLSTTNQANNTHDSDNTVSKTRSTQLDAENCVLDNSPPKAKSLSDDNRNLPTKLINNASKSVLDSAQEGNMGIVIASDQLETKESSIGDENNLNLPGSVRDIISSNCEQFTNPENVANVQEKQPDLIDNAAKVLKINSEQPHTKPAATSGTNLEGCSKEILDHFSNATNSCNDIVEQRINKEKENLSGMKDISSNNNGVEAMITEDHLEGSESGMNGSGIENMTIPNNNFKNIPTCNGNTQQSRDQEKINKNKLNGNPDHSIDNSEPMVTDDLSEKGKIINEIQSDAESNTDMNNGMEGIRNANIVEAMNKDQSWKADKVYKKDLRSLKLLCDYGSDSDGDDNEETMKEDTNNSSKTIVSNVPAVNPCPAVQQEYREPDVVSVSDSEESSEDETSSTSSATSSSSSDETEESENECVVVKEKVKKEVPKTKGELGLEDLPPIEDLHITVPESECVEIGKVLSIVDSLVVVQSIKGCPALDLDSVLFLDHGHNALGEVFDVFGKVGEACYCVRFNSKDHALQKGVEVGMPVYYAPRTEYSKYVFLADLTKMKGSDASWAHNNEPPEKFLDYSDDEQERRARKGNKPPVRNVEREETQPQAKRSYQRGRGWGNGAPTSPRSNRPWATPFNRYASDVSPSPPQSPSAAPKPLIRPSSFRNSDPVPSHGHDSDRSFGGVSHPAGPSFQSSMQPPAYRNAGPPQSHFHNNSAMGGPPQMYRYQSSFMPSPSQSHFHNAAAGAPPVFGTSQQLFPSLFRREDFVYDMNIPPPQSSFGHNQMGQSTMNTNDGSYRQIPPSANIMRPTSIPNPGLFAVEPSNGFKAEAPSLFDPNQPPSMKQDCHSSFGEGPPSSFGSQQPVFMNRNVPPPTPPTHQSPPPQHPHMRW